MIIQRMTEGAVHANTLTANADALATLEVVEVGVRCRYVSRWTDRSGYPRREVVQYEVPWRVLETAHVNPLVEALNLCRTTMETHLHDCRERDRGCPVKSR